MTNPPFSDQAWSIIASVFGAFLSLAFMRDLKPADAVTAIGSGVLGAVYLGMPIATYLQVTSASGNRALGFGIGLFAMSLLGGCFTLAAQWRINPASIISRFAPNWWKPRNGQ